MSKKNLQAFQLDASGVCKTCSVLLKFASQAPLSCLCCQVSIICSLILIFHSLGIFVFSEQVWIPPFTLNCLLGLFDQMEKTLSSKSGLWPAARWDSKNSETRLSDSDCLWPIHTWFDVGWLFMTRALWTELRLFLHLGKKGGWEITRLILGKENGQRQACCKLVSSKLD